MKKGKFSAIDVLIVIFLALVIVFGILKIKNIKELGETEQKIRFSVLASNVNEGTGSVITVGDSVSISVKEKAYATVVDVSETPHYEYDFSANLGKYAYEAVDGKSDILLELECMANVSDTEILNENVAIRVGEPSYIHGKGYALEGYIVTVDEVEK